MPHAAVHERQRRNFFSDNYFIPNFGCLLQTRFWLPVRMAQIWWSSPDPILVAYSGPDFGCLLRTRYRLATPKPILIASTRPDIFFALNSYED